MCVHNVDGQRGWTGECPDSGRCLCGFFPEVGPAFPQPRYRSAATPGIGRTIFRIMLGIGAVLLALIMIGVWVIGPDEDERRRRLCCHE